MTADKITRDTAIVKIYQAGESCAAIAKRVGMSRQRVHQIILTRTHNPQPVLAARRDKRRKALIAVVTPLIKAGFTRAEIIRQGVAETDFLFLQTHVPAIFKDHHQHIAFKKYGVRVDQFEALAAPNQTPWRKFKSMYDVARHMTITKRQKLWHLTFIEWFTLWSQSGAWQLDNINEWPRHGMVLIDENLPYQVGNIRIIPMSLVSQTWWQKNGKKQWRYNP
jgi:ribosomal protein L34